MIFVWSSGGRRGAGGILPLHMIGLCLYLLQMIDLDSLLFSPNNNNNRRSRAIALDPTTAVILGMLVVVIPISLLFAWLWKSGGGGLAAGQEGLRRRLTRLERSVADVTGLRVPVGAVLLVLAVIVTLLAIRLGSVASVLSVVTNLVGIYVATMSFVDFWRAGPTPGGAEGDEPSGRERTGGGLGGFWSGDHPWWSYPGDDVGGGRGGEGRGEGTDTPLSHIVKIVQGMPIEEYVPDDELAGCTVSQLRRMIELRRARHHTGDGASAAAASAVEKGELVDAARRCRNYDEGDEEGPCCIICQEEYLRGDPLRILPRCGHEFHVECIDRWAYAFASRRDSSARSSAQREPSCPLCKTALKE